MSLLTLPFPNIDPVAFSIGGYVTVKWYGLAYLTGLVLGWVYIRRIVRQPALWAAGRAPFPVEKVDDLLLYMTAGVIIGGRLGSVLLYEPGHYLRNPLDVPMIWKGGMAFHGALIGCGVAVWLFSRSARANAWSVMDACAAAVPIGLLFGRLANFVNGELYGRPSSVPWAMVFPEAVRADGREVPRHPSQLYEAFLEGAVLFAILRLLTHKRGALQSPGLVTGVFLAGYGVFRSFCELFRQPDVAHAFTVGPLTPGITYSIPMILLGLWLIARARKAASPPFPQVRDA